MTIYSGHNRLPALLYSSEDPADTINNNIDGIALKPVTTPRSMPVEKNLPQAPPIDEASSLA